MMSPTPIGIVSGSGIALESLLDRHDAQYSFAEALGISVETIAGHKGEFIEGVCDGIPILLQCGRLHFYEGYDYATVNRTVDFMYEKGVRTVIYTNAAGGLKPNMKPGDLLAADTLALWPCQRWPEHPETVDTDMILEGCDHRGTYTWVHGPCYETQSEIHALQATNSDAVGMSTAPELQRCHELGMRGASISCITNNCCAPQTLTHEHVMEIAATASERICGIIRNALPGLKIVA